MPTKLRKPAVSPELDAAERLALRETQQAALEDAADQLSAQNENLRVAQADLEESRNRYAELYDCSPVGYLTLDGAGRILELNLTGAALLGRERTSVVGLPLNAYIRDRGELLKLQAHLRACRKGAQPVLTRLSLAPRGCEPLTVQLVSRPVAQDGAVRFFTILTDLSAQIQAERILEENQQALHVANEQLARLLEERTAALSRSEMLKEAAFDSIAAQLVVLDKAGEILAVNRRADGHSPSALFEADEASGNYLQTCRRAAAQSQDGAAQAALGISAVLSGNLQHFHLEYRRPLAKGADAWFSLNVTPLGLGNGAVLLHENISDRKMLEREILEVGELERRNIGQDLHDGLCQYLTGTALMAAALARTLGEMPEGGKAQEIARFVRAAIDQTRQIARGLHPVEIDSQGLVSALEELAADMSKRVPCEFRAEKDVAVIDSIVGVTFYRIAQEAVINALKHGNPAKVTITLSQPGAYLVLTIEDDGVGFHPVAANRRKGMGLSIMKYRASALGAKFEVSNRPEAGVRVICSLPVEPGGEGRASKASDRPAYPGSRQTTPRIPRNAGAEGAR